MEQVGGGADAHRAGAAAGQGRDERPGRVSEKNPLEGQAADAGRALERARAAAEVAEEHQKAGTPHLAEGWLVLERMHLETARAVEERARTDS